MLVKKQQKTCKNAKTKLKIKRKQFSVVVLNFFQGMLYIQNYLKIDGWTDINRFVEVALRLKIKSLFFELEMSVFGRRSRAIYHHRVE